MSFDHSSRSALKVLRAAGLPVMVAALLSACGNAGQDAPGSHSPASSEALQCADSLAALIPQTGNYSRSIHSDSLEAQAFFDQGLRLTYGYYFLEAMASFDAALCFDADNPMLYWGRALAIAPNPNSRYGASPDDPQGEGKAAIAQARARYENWNPVDKGLIDALAVAFDTDRYPDRAERSQAFIEASLDLYRQYPEDSEVAFLAADAIMMASPWQYFDWNGAAIGYAADALRILEDGMARDPLHPGLNHLHIHLLENSRQPERAEVSADRLESLTPKAGHMVHMPGHIYMRVGRYDDAIATNERSLAADAFLLEHWGDRPYPSGATYALSARGHGGHARNFIQWGSLLQGNSGRAIEGARTMAEGVSQEALNRGSSLRAPAVYYMTLRAFGRWDEILSLPIAPDSQPYLAGILHAARGSALIAQGDLAAADAELAQVQRAASNPVLQKQRASVNSAAVLLSIAENLLKGEIASARGNMAEAIEHFQLAVSTQDQLRYMEPPDWMHSSRLYLGQAYLKAGQPEKAEAVFREDLDLLRENGWALRGLLESLKSQHKEGDAGVVQARLEKAWAKADVSLAAAHF